TSAGTSTSWQPVATDYVATVDVGGPSSRRQPRARAPRSAAASQAQDRRRGRPLAKSSVVRREAKLSTLPSKNRSRPPPCRGRYSNPLLGPSTNWFASASKVAKAPPSLIAAASAS